MVTVFDIVVDDITFFASVECQIMLPHDLDLRKRIAFIQMHPVETVEPVQQRFVIGPSAAVPEDYHENHDLNYVKALITELQRKYNIDEGRIFMQGMSAGNLMTAQFCRYYGNILAGAAGSGGGPSGFLRRPEKK